MRAVVQRVIGARVSVAGATVGEFEGPGLCVLLGVTHTDTPDVAQRCAQKVHELRIFDRDRLAAQLGGQPVALPGGTSMREVSAADAGLPILVVSQFTLYGSTRKGRRPTWDQAAPGPLAEPLVEHFVATLRARGAHVATGVFAADMQVALVNDGPVTVIVELDPA
jgi:D-tyrosyl-tRNA(Tyr) deacylase